MTFQGVAWICWLKVFYLPFLWVLIKIGVSNERAVGSAGTWGREEPG